MDHLGKWYLGFHLFPSIWFGLGEEFWKKYLCGRNLRKAEPGNKVFFPKFRGQVVFCHGVSGEAILDDKMWLLVQESSEGK
jgi:hypothetical protein